MIFFQYDKIDLLVRVELQDGEFCLTYRTDGVVREPGIISGPGLVAPILTSPVSYQPAHKLGEGRLLGELAQSDQLQREIKGKEKNISSN